MPVGFYELPDRDLEVRVEEKIIVTPSDTQAMSKNIMDACKVAKGTSKRVTVDFSAVQFLSSATISELLRIARYAEKNSIGYRIVNLRQEILDLFSNGGSGADE